MPRSQTRTWSKLAAAYLPVAHLVYKMAYPAGGQEEELFSLSMRPFQQVKQRGKTICFKCFEEDGLVNFFLQGAGLSRHSRTLYRNAAVDSAKNMQSSFSGSSRRRNGEGR